MLGPLGNPLQERHESGRQTLHGRPLEEIPEVVQPPCQDSAFAAQDERKIELDLASLQGERLQLETG